MSISTLTTATLTIPYMPMTVPVLDCAPPILESELLNCQIPGGPSFWSSNGFYSPGVCFLGYEAECTQAPSAAYRGDIWPIDEGETAVMCIPSGYECNEVNGNQRYATTEYDGTTLSAPAFEIRWRSEDLETGGLVPWPGMGSATSKKSGISAPSTIGTWEKSTPVTAPTVKPSRSEDSTSLPTAPATASSSPSPLTTGSIAGIAVGASVGTVVTILSLIYLAMRRHRRASKSTSSSEPHDPPPPPPSYAMSPIQPPVEVHSESMGPRELESAPVSPSSPVSPTSTLVGRDSNAVALNRVPIEMPGDETFTRDTGVDEVKERMSGTTRADEAEGHNGRDQQPGTK